jgi:hypothetical protein
MTTTGSLMIGQWRRIRGLSNRHYVTREITPMRVETACGYNWTSWSQGVDAGMFFTIDEPGKRRCVACCKALGETPDAPKNPPVKGHGLLEGGSPHDDAGNALRDAHGWPVYSAHGRAKCQCGAMSEVLKATTHRKAWHRAHKTTITIPPALED